MTTSSFTQPFDIGQQMDYRNMASLLEPSDYDVFDYKLDEERPVTLEEALKKTSSLRSSDKSHFHRILPVDETLSGFRVVSVSKSDVLAEMVSKAAGLRARLLGHRWQAEQRPK